MTTHTASELVTAAIAMSTPVRFLTPGQSTILGKVLGDPEEEDRELVFELANQITTLMHVACCIQAREGCIIDDDEIDRMLA